MVRYFYAVLKTSNSRNHQRRNTKSQRPRSIGRTACRKIQNATITRSPDSASSNVHHTSYGPIRSIPRAKQNSNPILHVPPSIERSVNYSPIARSNAFSDLTSESSRCDSISQQLSKHHAAQFSPVHIDIDIDIDTAVDDLNFRTPTTIHTWPYVSPAEPSTANMSGSLIGLCQ